MFDSASTRLPFRFLLVSLLSLVLASAAGAQEAPPLFEEGGGAEPGERETVVRTRTAFLNMTALTTVLEEGEGSLHLNLFEDVSVVAHTARIQRWSASQYSWFGTLEEAEGQITMEIDQFASTVFATLTINGRSYRIEQRQGHQYAIDELDLTGLRDEPLEQGEEGDPQSIGWGDDAVKSGSGTPSPSNTSPVPEFDVSTNTLSSAAKAWKNGAEVIDLLILYTEQARNAAGSAASMEAKIRNAINNANTSFQDSGVNARFRLATSQVVTYPEGSKNSISGMRSDLRREGNTSGDVVNQLRNNYGADIVGLVVRDAPDACGMAYIMKNVSTGHRDKAYFVVEEGASPCATNNHSFAHEIGHIMGARHDRYVDDTDGSPYDYNHAYVNPESNWSNSGQWRTVMAYNDRCDCTDEPNPVFRQCPKPDNRDTNTQPWCTRLLRWSDPDDARSGDPMGIASGGNAADNVRTLNNTASTVADFKSPSPIVSGTVTDLLSGSGSGLADVEIRGPLGPITDSNGEYEMFVHWGSVQLRPNKGDYEFTPGPAVTLNNVTSNRTQDFDAGIYHQLEGTVYVGSTRQLLSNVELQGAPGAPPPPTPTVGDFSFRVLQGWTGTITPQSDKYTFSPADRSYTGNGIVSDTLDQDFVASINTYTISGRVEDASGSPIPNVTMQGLPRDPQTDSFGQYSVTLDYGWSGTVTPTKAGYTFQPVSQSYSSLDSDHDDDYTGTQSVFAASKWPLFGGDTRRSGYQQRTTVPYNLRWSAPINTEVMSPVIGSGGNVYVGAADGALHAFDTQGTKLWSTKAVPGDSIHAAPAAASGYRFYVPVDGGNLIAYDRQGALTWSRYLDGELHSSPVVGPNGVIYVGSDSDSLYAVNPDGTKRWAVGTGGNVRSSPAIGPNGTIYVGSDDGYLYAIRSDGTQKWRFQTGGPVRSSPAVAGDGTIYVGSDDDAIYAIDASGTQQWSVSTGGNVRSSPALGPDGDIYVGSNDGSVYALTPSGQQAWTYATGAAVVSSPAVSYDANEDDPALPEEIVYVGSTDGAVLGLDARASSASNRVQWTYTTLSSVKSSPALGEGGLYIGSEAGTLYNLGPETEGDGRSRLQLVAAAMAPTPEEIAIINRIAGDVDPFGEPGWMNPEGCEGGPLIIPACGGPGARFGGASGFKDIVTGESLRFGALAPWVLEEPGMLDQILSGETTEGVHSFVRSFEAGQDYLAVLSGFSAPSEHPANPDGRSTALNLFVKEGALAESPDPEMVQVMAGHFVPDAPEMQIAVASMDGAVGTLRYGDVSAYRALPPGRYTVTMQPTDGDLPKREGSSRLTFPLDLTGRAGETVALLATGTYEATGQPPLSIRAVGSEGDMQDLDRLEGALAPGLSTLPGLFEDDLLLEPGRRVPVTFEPQVRLDGLSGTPSDVRALLPSLSTAEGSLVEPVEAPVPQPFEVPASAVAFRTAPERVAMEGQPLDAMPERLQEALETADLNATHVGRLTLTRPSGTYEFWLAMRQMEGYALPAASLLRAETSLDIDAVVNGILTSYRPERMELAPQPEPGEFFALSMALRMEVRPVGGDYVPVSELPLMMGAAGEAVGVEQITVAQRDGRPAKLDAPIVLRLDELILGPEGQRTPVRGGAYVALDRREAQHRLAAMLGGTGEGDDLTIHRGAVYAVDRRDGLQASFASTVEGDGLVDFGPTGVDVAFEGTGGTGTVTVQKFGTGPDGLRGIAGANISDYRFVMEAGGTLEIGDGSTLRLDVDALSGIPTPRAVTIYHRPTPGEGTFRPLSTRYDAETDELVAPIDGLSEFVLASDSSPLPVEIAGLQVQQTGDRVVLTWVTASETNNAGFQVQRTTPRRAQWTDLGFVRGTGTTTQRQTYRFADADAPYAADSLIYRLRQVDTDGSETLSERVTFQRSVPETVRLQSTFPNPARTQATVRFALPQRTDVSLRVYDVLGRRIATLRRGSVEAGRQQMQVDVADFASGVYFLRLKAGDVTRTQKVTVVR